MKASIECIGGLAAHCEWMVDAKNSATESAFRERVRFEIHDLFVEEEDGLLAVAEAFPQADDRDILARAMGEKRVLIINDKDFGDLIFRSGQTHHGVVLLRLRDESAANKVRVVRNLLERYADRLPNHFVVVTEASVRIRANLPSS